MQSNSLSDADFNLPEMKTKSPSCPAGGVHMYVDYNSFWKIHCFIFFLYKSIQDQIWSCHKIGQVNHHLNKLGNSRVPDAAYMYLVSRS